MSKGIIFKILDDAEEDVKKPLCDLFGCGSLNPVLNRVDIPNIMEKAEQNNIAFEDAYIAILAHMAKHKMSEIDFDISKVENSIIHCDCCRKLIERPIKLNLPYELEVCQSCASKIEDYVNSISRKDERHDFLSDEDVMDIFEKQTANVCKENNVKVTKVIPMKSGMTKHYDFYYNGKCIYTCGISKLATCISPYESSKLAAVIVEKIREEK